MASVLAPTPLPEPGPDPRFAPGDGADWRAVIGGLLPALLRERGDFLSVQQLVSGRYVHADAGLAPLLGLDEGALVGRCDAELFDAPVTAALRAAAQTAAAHGAALTSDHRFELGGQRRELRVLRWVVPSGERGPGWMICVWHDLEPELARQHQLRHALEQIEQQQRVHESLRRELADQSLRDPASGLHSRAHFEDQLRREVDLSTREHREFALVLIELDPPGDKLRAHGADGRTRILEALGGLLRGGTRAMDASCRLDESRFAVLLSGVGLATAHSRMEGLRRKCATQIVVHEGDDLGFTVAMGVASFPHTAHTQAELLSACEAALAEAKRRGGNHVTLAAIRFEPA